MADEAVADSTESAPVVPPAEPANFTEFLSLKNEAKAASAKVEAKPAEAAQAEHESESAPGESVTETPSEKKELTAEERSARDRERNERRWTKINRELGAERAERQRLQEQLDVALKARKEESSPSPKSEGMPKLKEFTSQIGAKYDTYEDAVEAYAEARDQAREKQLEAKFDAKRHAETAEVTKAELKSKFNQRIESYAKQSDVFEDQRELLTEVLGDNAQHIETAIVMSEHPGELIAKLAENDGEAARRLIGLPRVQALVELGVLAAQFTTKKASEGTPQPKTREPLPPTPTVRGRGTVVSHLEVASKASDFASFTAAKKAAKAAGAKL